MACYHNLSCRAPLFVSLILYPHPYSHPLSPYAPSLMCLIHMLGCVCVYSQQHTPRRGLSCLPPYAFLVSWETDCQVVSQDGCPSSPPTLRSVSWCFPCICISLLTREIEHLMYLLVNRIEALSAVRRKFNTQVCYLPLLGPEGNAASRDLALKSFGSCGSIFWITVQVSVSSPFTLLKFRVSFLLSQIIPYFEFLRTVWPTVEFWMDTFHLLDFVMLPFFFSHQGTPPMHPGTYNSICCMNSRAGVSFLPTRSSLNHKVFPLPAFLFASPTRLMDHSPGSILKPTGEGFQASVTQPSPPKTRSQSSAMGSGTGTT